MKPRDFHSSKASKAVRTQNGYWAFIPAPLPPDLDWTPALITALSNAERKLARLTTLAGDFPFPRLLIQPFIRREAVLSSRIEGTRASLADLYTLHGHKLRFLKELKAQG